jgi:dihydrofolate reductase
MGTTVYWMNVSMDLRIEHEPGEQGGGSWLRIDEELHREFNRRARDLSVLIQGRVVYEIMEGFWPTAAKDQSLPDFLQEYGEFWTRCPKVLVSRGRTKADYNTKVIGSWGEAIQKISVLRSEVEGNIGVGGATLATELLHAGLLDELLLFMHPVVLGSGRPLFNELKAPLACDLVEHKAFASGVTMLRYRVQRSDEDKGLSH